MKKPLNEIDVSEFRKITCWVCTCRRCGDAIYSTHAPQNEGILFCDRCLKYVDIVDRGSK